MNKFLKILPTAIQIAQIAEAAVPLPGQGGAKLAFALDAAQAAYETEEDLRTSWGDKTKFLDSISRAIQVSVGLMNAAGVFKKAAPAH
jgi:hypothetical protein